MKEITSLQNNIIKHLVKLRESKSYRYDQQHVVISGLKLIKELSRTHSFKRVFVLNDYSPTFSFQTEETYQVSESILKKISGISSPEPLVAEIAMPSLAKFNPGPCLLILDGISDPGNLGTLLRSALALGFDHVFLTDRSADPFNEKAIRSAKGATFTLCWKTGSWEELKALIEKHHFHVFAADPRGKSIANCHFPHPLALVLGNESHGISSNIEKIAEAISIPMNPAMESLNVATAGAILMYRMNGHEK